MHKEKVTLENIMADLHQEIKSSYIELAKAFLFFIFVLAFLCFIIPLIFGFFNSGFTLSDFSELDDYSKEFLLQVVLYFGVGIYVLISLIKRIARVVTLRKSLKSKPYIVKDTLIKSDYISRRRFKDTYRLFFSQYGKYIVPYKNYSWSSEFCMGASGVFTHAFEGSEFYLVLSDLPQGKILYAYNTTLFELEDNLKTTTLWDNYRY